LSLKFHGELLELPGQFRGNRLAEIYQQNVGRAARDVEKSKGSAYVFAAEAVAVWGSIAR
jgi:hypothetical protein